MYLTIKGEVSFACFVTFIVIVVTKGSIMSGQLMPVIAETGNYCRQETSINDRVDCFFAANLLTENSMRYHT